MIQVAGRPFSQENAVDLGSVGHVILQQMLESPELFAYPSMNELHFELNMRIHILDSAKEMNASQVTFTTFEHAQCNPAYWTLTYAGGFLLRNDVQPSEAILDIYRNSSLYAFECATAIIIIYYQAILKSIGSRRFNSIFQNLYLYSWHTDTSLELNSVYSSTRFLPGDVVYFNNPDFHPHTPWYRGENAVVMSDGTFFGHGFGIMTAEEMIQFLNEQRSPGSMQAAYLATLLTRISPETMHMLLHLHRGRIFYQPTKKVVHHNLCSISCIDYQYFLNGHQI
ncbi:protein-glutamine gamma-glutamyltransferase [Halalkalibacter sp. AB-rgal2]|uniref:protein-glutamine gamma-glutamyltransferase n=1 Tax=Halalkalibacter sp. AB-rgal2 TaxID=3242695 RepID=UPI00359D385E